MNNPLLTFSRGTILVTLCLFLMSLTAAAQTPAPEQQPGAALETPFPPSGNSTAAGGVRSYLMQVAVKSNMLFLAAGTPNIGLEFPVSDQFSITATGAFTRLTIKQTYAIQTLQGGLDFKYWFGAGGGRTLTGWNAGVYMVAGAPWDVQWKTGWQGDSFLSAGLEGGYSLCIGKKWNLEFLLAAGWFHTPEARQYRKEGGHMMWQQSRQNVHRFSLTKAQVNLVWHFGRK